MGLNETLYQDENPKDYLYDPDLIEWPSLSSPSLKELDLFTSLDMYLPLVSNSDNISNYTKNTTPTDITHTQGRINGSAQFNGTTSKIQLLDPWYVGTGPIVFSTSFWIKQTGVTNTGRAFGYDINGVLVFCEFTTQSSVRLVTGGGVSLVYNTDLSGWVHVATNYRSDSLVELFVNGTLVNSGTQNAPSGLGTEKAFIGSARDGVQRLFEGNIEQFLMRSNNPFTLEEVSQIYNAGVGQYITKLTTSAPTIQQYRNKMHDFYCYYRFKNEATLLQDSIKGNHLINTTNALPILTYGTTIDNKIQPIITNANLNYLTFPSALFPTQEYEQTLMFNIDVDNSFGFTTLAILNGLNGMGLVIQMNSASFSYGVYSDSNVFRSASTPIGANGWKHVALSAKFTQISTGVYDLVLIFSVAGVAQKTTTFSAIGAPSFWDGGTRDNLLFGLPSGFGTEFYGSINNLCIANTALSTEEIAGIAGKAGRVDKYYLAETKFHQFLPHVDDQIVGYNNYDALHSGTGSVALRITDVRDVDKYWDGLIWNTGDTNLFSSIPTVNSNISNLSPTSQSIATSIALISDGFQPVTLIQEQLSYSSNQIPIIDAGLNKPRGGDPLITNAISVRLFIDSAFSDIEGPITTVLYSINANTFINIPQTIYATLLEATQALLINMGSLGAGVHTVTLKVIDSLGAEASASFTVSVIDILTSQISNIDTNVQSLLALLQTVNTKVDTSIVGISTNTSKLTSVETKIDAMIVADISLDSFVRSNLDVVVSTRTSQVSTDALSVTINQSKTITDLHYDVFLGNRRKFTQAGTSYAEYQKQDGTVIKTFVLDDLLNVTTRTGQ